MSANNSQDALSDADRKRFEDLFAKLDVNKDGKIEVHELSVALKSLKGVKDVDKQAEAMMTRADKDASAEISFAEFVDYMHEHERKLQLAFSDLDRNKDGKIEPSEVKEAMQKLGLNIDIAEAEKLTRRIDRDGSLSLDWTEWRNFFQLYPSGDLEDIVAYWRQNLMIDIGENLTVPPEFTQKERKTGMWWRHLVAGGAAGVVSRTGTAPLDRLKVMLQVHGSHSKMGIADGFKKMIAEGGVKSLWRGNGTNVLKIAPESAAKFAAYEQLKKLIKGDSKHEISIIERFAAGSTAGAIAQTSIYPMEVIKTRLAVAKTGQYKGMLDCGLKIFKKEGAMALYRGYIPNILGIIPYAGIDLTIYETIKNWYIKNNPKQQDPGVLVLLGCGTVSSTCGQLASYPLALVRTRLQAAATDDAKLGFVQLGRNIIKRDGFFGLYRGIAPNFLKVLPAVSISYVVYERSKIQLGIK
jgi:solute carrier family 25 phosphate transporter 23/24/25/41